MLKMAYLNILNPAHTQTPRRGHTMKECTRRWTVASYEPQRFISWLSGSWKIQDQGMAHSGSGEGRLPPRRCFLTEASPHGTRYWPWGSSFIGALISIREWDVHNPMLLKGKPYDLGRWVFHMSIWEWLIRWHLQDVVWSRHAKSLWICCPRT